MALVRKYWIVILLLVWVAVWFALSDRGDGAGAGEDVAVHETQPESDAPPVADAQDEVSDETLAREPEPEVLAANEGSKQDVEAEASGKVADHPATGEDTQRSIAPVESPRAEKANEAGRPGTEDAAERETQPESDAPPVADAHDETSARVPEPEALASNEGSKHDVKAATSGKAGDRPATGKDAQRSIAPIESPRVDTASEARRPQTTRAETRSMHGMIAPGAPEIRVPHSVHASPRRDAAAEASASARRSVDAVIREARQAFHDQGVDASVVMLEESLARAEFDDIDRARLLAELGDAYRGAGMTEHARTAYRSSLLQLPPRERAMMERRYGMQGRL